MVPLILTFLSKTSSVLTVNYFAYVPNSSQQSINDALTASPTPSSTIWYFSNWQQAGRSQVKLGKINVELAFWSNWGKKYEEARLLWALSSISEGHWPFIVICLVVNWLTTESSELPTLNTISNRISKGLFEFYISTVPQELGRQGTGILEVSISGTSSEGSDDKSLYTTSTT